MPPRGVKKGSKRERQYKHIKKSEKEAGRSNDRAEEIAARAVNKEKARSGESKSSSRSSTRGRSASSRGGKRSGHGPGGRTREQLYNDARDTLARFNSTATRIESILADAQAGKGTLGRFVTDETLYNNINQTASNVNQLSSEGTKLIYDFRQNPRKYLRIKVSIF